jgi:hypothetical protein
MRKRNPARINFRAGFLFYFPKNFPDFFRDFFPPGILTAFKGVAESPDGIPKSRF